MYVGMAPPGTVPYTRSRSYIGTLSAIFHQEPRDTTVSVNGASRIPSPVLPPSWEGHQLHVTAQARSTGGFGESTGEHLEDPQSLLVPAGHRDVTVALRASWKQLIHSPAQLCKKCELNMRLPQGNVHTHTHTRVQYVEQLHL